MPASKPRVDAFVALGCKKKLAIFPEECCCAVMTSITDTAIVSDQAARHCMTLSFSAMSRTCKSMAGAARDALASHGPQILVISPDCRVLARRRVTNGCVHTTYNVFTTFCTNSEETKWIHDTLSIFITI
jgi:hypothetical protein